MTYFSEAFERAISGEAASDETGNVVSLQEHRDRLLELEYGVSIAQLREEALRRFPECGSDHEAAMRLFGSIPPDRWNDVYADSREHH